MDDLSIYEEIVRLKKERKPAALATVIETSGSTPRKAGAKMLVYQSGSIAGTIGGGKAEADTIAAAQDAMQSGESRILQFSSPEENGNICGATMLVYLEPSGAAPRMVAIGSGHVAKAVCRAAEAAGFLVNLLPPEENLAELLLERCADPESYILIATSTHQQDFSAARLALKTPARYIGVIGSRKKRKALDSYLSAQGLSATDIDRVISPAGIDIGAETPDEIAVSVVAQMIQVLRA
ncbi:MAG: XdhC family protein [Pseudomonadota bacterium]